VSTSRFEHLGDEPRHQGYLWRVVTGRFRAPDGVEFTRDVVRSPGAVGVLPLWRDTTGCVRVLLIRQYRPVMDRYVVEIPAGMRDVPGESPAATALRELIEEAGLNAQQVTPLLDMIPSPGMTDGTTMVFVATGLTSVPSQAHGPEEEHLELLEMDLDDAIADIDRGVITDAKTVVALLMTSRQVSSGVLAVPSR
jgi:8-oxo-dGTP pyrophosphatase MutT (NUDIX family)